MLSSTLAQYDIERRLNSATSTITAATTRKTRSTGADGGGSGSSCCCVHGVCIYIYIYIYIHTHAHTYIYIYTHTYYLLITLTTPWEKIVTAVLAQSSHVSPHWCFPGSIHERSCSSGRRSRYEEGSGFRVLGGRFWDLGKLSSRYRTPDAVEAWKT